MVNSYEGIIVHDHLHGTGLRHLFVSPPIDDEEMLASIEQSAKVRHISSEGGWTRFVIDANNFTGSEDIFGTAREVIEGSPAGGELEKIPELEHNSSWQALMSFITRRGMKHD